MSWSDNKNPKAGVKKPVSTGGRLIIVHAGTNKGFINNGLLIFKSGRKTGDYHDEINSSNYKKWLNNKLVINLPDKSVLVVDNVSYHNAIGEKRPTSSTIKSEMINWLSERNVQVDAKLTKTEFNELIKPLKDKEKYTKLIL